MLIVGEAVVTNWVTLDEADENQSRTPTPTLPDTSRQLVEAQGWIITPDGKVVLTAKAPTVTPQSPGVATPTCKDLPTVPN